MKLSKLALGVVVAVLAMAMVGCNGDQSATGAKAANGIAHGLAIAQQENQLLYGNGLLSPAEARAVGAAVVRGTLANDGFASCIKAIRGASAASSKAQALACADTLDSQLQGLDAAVLGIKNPDSKAAMMLALEAEKTALLTIKAVLQ